MRAPFTFLVLLSVFLWAGCQGPYWWQCPGGSCDEAGEPGIVDQDGDESAQVATICFHRVLSEAAFGKQVFDELPLEPGPVSLGGGIDFERGQGIDSGRPEPPDPS